MRKTDGFIWIANSSQGTISLNCSYREGDNLVEKFYDILPARECVVGKQIPIEDWNRIKHITPIVSMIDNGILLPEKKKVTIDQETWKTSVPEPTGELKEASLDNLVKKNESSVTVGTRKARTKLK